MNREKDSNSCKKTDYWEQQVVAWEESGKSQTEFCRQHAIRVSAFGYWKRKLRPQPPEVVQFYPLTVPPSRPAQFSSGIRLVPSNKKFHIELSADFSANTLKTLINTLEEI